MKKTCLIGRFCDQPRSRKIWYYETEESLADVLDPGYFAPAAHLLGRLDTIEVMAETGGIPIPCTLIVIAVDPSAPPNLRVVVRQSHALAVRYWKRVRARPVERTATPAPARLTQWPDGAHRKD